MLDFAVDDLDAFLARLKTKGVTILKLGGAGVHLYRLRKAGDRRRPVERFAPAFVVEVSMRSSKLRREIRFLRCYALGVTVLGGALFLVGAVHATRPAEFDRITAHRIDVVDREGKLAMILTDHDDFPDPVINGKTVHRTSGLDENGIVFYNQDGNEQGAFMWDGRRGPHGATSANTLSYDAADSDQLLQLDDGTDQGKHFAGLHAWDRSPEALGLVQQWRQELAGMRTDAQRRTLRAKYRELGAFGFDRFFAGYDSDDTSQVALADGRGRTRVKLYVTKDGHAQLQFLDEQGHVVDQYPKAVSAGGSPSP